MLAAKSHLFARRCAMVCLPTCAAMLLVLAASPSKAEETEPIELTVSPAAEPVPALRYHLLPPPEQRIRGNAAPIYLRLPYEQSDEWRRRLREEPSRLLEMPAAEMPLEDAARLMDTFDTALEQMSAASLRTECNWEYVTEGRDPMMILLPDAQMMRSNARLLAVVARYQIRTDKFDDAVATLRDGLALGGHVSQAPFLVNQLIGVAIDQMILLQVDDFVSRPGAPNLYWALAELPRPLISFDRGLAAESQFLQMKLPALSDLSGPHDWPRLAEAMRRYALEIARLEQKFTELATLSKLRKLSAEELARARESLVSAQQLSAAEVAAMSDAEVEVRYTVALYRETSDAWRKWFYVPYAKSLPEYTARTEALRNETRRRELYPLVSLLTPLSGNLLMSTARQDRALARQQVIEALRMHAAQTGQLPDKLDDVTIVPVPLDPVGGVPFAYHRDGEAAVLDVAHNYGMDDASLRLPVRLKLRTK